MKQKSEQSEFDRQRLGEADAETFSAESEPTTPASANPGNGELMSLVCKRENLNAAWRKVVRNKGSAGVDGMTVEELAPYLREHGKRLREQMLAGRYTPQPIKQVVIPKPDGGQRKLGIPTVIDRFVQQAILQVLQPIFDAMFSDHSYGFRPGRSAHGAIRRAQEYVQAGRCWVVDLDLSNFFDRVNHDILMGKLAKRIGDKHLLRLIRRYLEAGMLVNGVVIEREQGTPQGGPLSPLLANVLLDEVDKELEQRGHSFVRYADDLNVYVSSERAGERVMQALRRMYAKLRLQVNDEKSAVARVEERKFLGFTLTVKDGQAKRTVAGKSIEKFKDKVRRLTHRSVGRSMSACAASLSTYLRGWKGYFGITDTPYQLRDLDGWIRRRLRALQLRHWRHGHRIYRKLRACGIDDRRARTVAAHAGRWWWLSGALGNTVLPNKYFDQLGLFRMAKP